MDALAGFASTIWDVLMDDEEAALSLVLAVNPFASRGQIELLEGPVTALEALTYVRVLAEIGRIDEAEALFSAVLHTAYDVPQGSQ